MISSFYQNTSFRNIQKSDHEIVRKIVKDKTIMKNVPFHSKKSHFFLVNGEIVGFYNIEKIHDYPEIQYAILKEYRNLNYGSLLLEKITSLIFEDSDVNRIYLMIHKQNISSMKVAIKNGYRMDEELQYQAFLADLDFPYYYFMRKNPYGKKNKILNRNKENV